MLRIVPLRWRAEPLSAACTRLAHIWGRTLSRPSPPSGPPRAGRDSRARLRGGAYDPGVPSAALQRARASGPPAVWLASLPQKPYGPSPCDLIEWSGLTLDSCTDTKLGAVVRVERQERAGDEEVDTVHQRVLRRPGSVYEAFPAARAGPRVSDPEAAVLNLAQDAEPREQQALAGAYQAF